MTCFWINEDRVMKRHTKHKIAFLKRNDTGVIFIFSTKIMLYFSNLKYAVK